MQSFIETFNTLSALGAIAFLLGGFVLFGLSLSHAYSDHRAIVWLKSRTLAFGFMVSLLAVVGSLIYSNVIGYPPCELCWIQRIFIYPQFVLYAIALWKNDKTVFKYAFALALLGLVVAIYHNWIDLGGSQFIACDTAVSCTRRYVAAFGFVTIPFMSLSALLALVGISALGIKHK